MTTFLGENSFIPQPTVVGRDAALAQLQGDVEDLAKLEKLAELQKQQMRQPLKGEVAQGIQQLAFLADRINALGTQLEAEMLKFKTIAIKTNQAYRAIQQSPDLKAMGWNELKSYRLRPLSIWEIHYSLIPIVVKKGAGFILTVKTVDLFQAEREENIQRQAKAAQHRRKALERWLLERRQL